MEVSTTFSQVVFQNIPHSYTPNVPVTCFYTLTSAIQPNPRDWVGIFKVGWSNTKDYHTFVWVEPSVGLGGQEPVMKQVIFTTYYLPKDDAEFYQFCYVDSTGLVRGASTPFCFKTPEEQSTDSSLENDLLIITTQEKVDQREREQEELARELRQQKELNETLRSTLKEQRQEIDRLKLSNEGSYQANRNLEKHQQNARDLVELTQNSGLEEKVEKCEREKAELAMELRLLKEQNEALKSTLMEQQNEVGRLEEKVEKNEREKAELAMELKEQKEQNQTLTSALQEQQDKSLSPIHEHHLGNLVSKHVTASLYPICEKYEQALIKIKQLKKEREELRGKVEVQSVEIAQLSPRLKESVQESHGLKCQFQLLQMCTSSKVIQREQLPSVTTSSEKYDQALTKIKQLKSERDELKRKVEELSEEIAQLSPRLRESELESSRLKDHIQLLQVDLRSTEKEKEKLSTELRRIESLTHNLEDLKTENKALRRSLSEQGQQQPLPEEKVDSDLKVKCQALLSQLQEANTKLQQEQQASSHSHRRAEHAEGELEELKERFESKDKTSTQMTLMNGKLEMKLTELHGIIQEKENMAEIAEVEKVELSRENQVLKRDIERLRREVADLQATQVSVHYSNPYSSTDPSPTAVQHQDTQANTLYFGNPYETPGTATNPHQDELSLECRHCHERFPGITQEELEQHELSHRVCPFCTLICDDMEQASYEDHVYSHEV